jgi:hypothetical protein
MAVSGGEAAREADRDVVRFPCHRQLAPMLWALIAIGLVEIGLVHLFVWHWNRPLALAVGAISLAALLFLVALSLSFRSRPIEMRRGGLRIRAGLLLDIEVPLAEIAFAQSGAAPADYMAGSLLKASLLASPNVIVLLRRDIDLLAPFGRKRRVHAVALAVDEPTRFLMALNARVKEEGVREGAAA